MDGFGEDKNHLPLQGFEPWTDQPVVSRCTDYATCPVDVWWRQDASDRYVTPMVLDVSTEITQNGL